MTSKRGNLNWKRPEGPLKTWRVIECHNAKNKSENPIKITIAEIPPSRYEETIEHMNNYFMRDEASAGSISEYDFVSFLFFLQ